MKMKKLVSLLFISLVIFSLSFSIVSARDLETIYPEVPGAETPITTDTDAGQYFKYIYYLAFGIGGLIAFGVLVYAGFQYFTSAGSPDKMGDAKNRITAALIGLLILFGSFLILYTINPGLLNFNLPKLRPIPAQLTPGVMVCTEMTNEIITIWDKQYEILWIESKSTNKDVIYEEQKKLADEIDVLMEKVVKNCRNVSSGNLQGSLDDKIMSIYFIPAIDYDSKLEKIINSYEYGAILYEDDGYKGASIPYVDHLEDPNGKIKVYPRIISSNYKISSIKTFQLSYYPGENWGVTFYDDYDFNDNAPHKKIKYGLVGTYHGDRCQILSGAECTPEQINAGICNYYWWCEESKLPFVPVSMKVDGDIIVVLEASNGKTDALSSGEYSNLEDYKEITKLVNCTTAYSNDQTPGVVLGPGTCIISDVQKVTLISGHIY